VSTRSVVVAMLFAVACVAAPFMGGSRAGGEPPAAAAVHYRSPVAGPIVDPFRPPATRYGPGNRGVDYATRPGQPVGAAGPGVVLFAGQVGGTLNVVVLHADNLRTSYSGLASIAVRRGEAVGLGQPIGTAADDVHVGVRAGAAYLDPQVLFDAGARVVHLVPDEPGGRP